MEMNYDEKTLREIEEELGTKIYPGTEIMTDVGSHHFVKSRQAVLVPQPSANPNDPLNWSPFWKTTTIALTTFTIFAQGFGSLAVGPINPILMEVFDKDLAAVIQFSGVSILVLGFSNFIWVPIQTSFGRRPVLIMSTLICFVACIWRGVANSYGSFMGACVLNGIGAGPAETAQPQITADIFFLHERGAYNTLYFTFYFAALIVGPVMIGPMADHVGWRSFWWLNVAVLGVALLLLIFAFPETKWHRAHPKELLNKTEKTEKTDDALAVKDGASSEGTPSPETAAPTEKQIEEGNLTREATEARDPYLGKGKPGKQQFKLWQIGKDPLKTMALDFWIPWKMHIYPIVEFAGFVVSWSASIFLSVNFTQAQNFGAPPYNYSGQTISIFNLAVLVGAFIGLFTNGILSDWISMWFTKRNRGVREPEMRLPALIPYVLIMIVGNFVVAYGQQNKWDWKPIVIVGYTAAGIQLASIPAIASTYAIDSYKPVAGSIFVTITVNKNLWGYGFSKFITTWIDKSGYVPPILINMALTVLWCLFAILFWFYGKTFRKWTANSEVHSM